MSQNNNQLACLPDSKSQGENSSQPRQPKNLQGLLKYAIEAGSKDSQPPVISQSSIDQERRQFLENALSGLTLNAVEEVQKNLNILKGIATYKDGDDVDELETAMDNLSDYLDSIDISKDFYKMGGLDVCFACILRGPAGVRWRAADLIARCSQNNPYCQECAIETNRLRPLIEAASSDPDRTARLKALYAVSCLVRQNSNALIQFLSLGGHRMILSCLKSNCDKLRVKAAFFLSSVANEEPSFKEELVKCGLLSELISLVMNGNEQESREHVLGALLALLIDHPPSAQICRQQPLLAPFLSELRRLHSSDDAFLEEVQYIEQILTIISMK